MIEDNKTAKPIDTLRNVLFYERNRVIQSLELYSKSGEDSQVFMGVVAPAIKSLFLQIKPEYADAEESKKILIILKSKNVSAILELYFEIDYWMRSKKLISFATTTRMNS